MNKQHLKARETKIRKMLERDDLRSSHEIQNERMKKLPDERVRI